MEVGKQYPGVAMVYFCHDGQGRILMGKRNNNARDEKGCWDIGGGKLEHGEVLEEAMKREIMEEYMAEVVSREFLGFRDIHRTLEDGCRTHWVALDFKVLINSSGVGVGEPYKFDAVEWFTLRTMPSPLHSQLPVFLDKYKEML